MSQVENQNRCQRFVEAMAGMAEECMGIKLSGGLVSQSLGYHEELEKVVFFVQINTDDTAVELMYPDPVFSPEHDNDDEIVSHVCAAFQTDDEDRVRDLLGKAELING